jgi:hypothetical protein
MVNSERQFQMNRYQVTTKSQKTGNEKMETYIAKDEADLNTQIQTALDFLAIKNVIKTVVSIVDLGTMRGISIHKFNARGNAELERSLATEEWYQ